MIALSDLLTPATGAQIRAAMVAALVNMGVPANSWRKSGALSTILTVVANSIANFSTLLASAIAAGFLPNATAGWLTLLAYYVYGVVRTSATQATGSYTLTNEGGAVFTGPSYASGQVQFLNSTTGQVYTNTDDLDLGAVGSSNAVQTIGIACVAFGSIGNAAPGDVDTITTSMIGVTGTNASAIVGLDAQSDADLRAQCTAKIAARSVRGPRDAYVYYATHDQNDNPLLNADGNPVNINRVSVSNASHTGDVLVVLASPSGAPIAEDVTAAAGSFEANVRPSAVTVTTQAAAEVAYSGALVVWAQAVSGLDAPTLAEGAADAIDTYLSTYPIGGFATDTAQGLFGSGIDGVVKASNPAIFKVDGASDLALAAGQVATNNITVSDITVRLVSAS